MNPDALKLVAENLATDKHVRMWLHAGGECHYCRRPMLLKPPTHPRAITVDHIVPKAKGGGAGGNVVAACCRCNILRGYLRQRWFKHIVEAFGPHLPEMGTKRFARLQGALHRLASSNPAKVRIPYRREVA